MVEATTEVVRYARRDHRVLALMAVKAGFGLAAGVLALIPVFGADVFVRGEIGVGILMAARGAGALVGPFLGHLISGRGHRRLFGAIGLALALFGLAYMALGLAPSLWIAAAVILDPDNIPPGLHDSKQLSAARREALFTLIMQSAFVSVASSGSRRIDTTDIRKASLDAMRRAVAGLEIAPNLVLTDGRDVPPGLACEGRAVVKGDALSVSIAAASIVAKVTRDRMMARAETSFPGYGFAIHAGYATEVHRKAIETNGPCRLHRMSFRPLRRD